MIILDIYLSIGYISNTKCHEIISQTYRAILQRSMLLLSPFHEGQLLSAYGVARRRCGQPGLSPSIMKGFFFCPP
jgi:hypothetical protein